MGALNGGPERGRAPLLPSSAQDLDDGLKKFEDQLLTARNDSKTKRVQTVQPLSKYQKDKRKRIHSELDRDKDNFN